MHILLHANVPWTGSGYGVQCALLAPRLKALGHHVAISATWGLSGGIVNWQGIRVYPADGDWGNRTLPTVASHFAGDGGHEDVQVIALHDAWVFRTEGWPDRMRFACWTPVDHDPAPSTVRKFFAKSKATPIAMSRFGEQALQRAGFTPLYVPHAVDTNLFKPQDKQAARDKYGLPPDAFVVGMVAENKASHMFSRKAFPQVFQAFSRFRERHQDAILYIHSEQLGLNGINLRQLAHACNIPPSALRFTDLFAYELGITPNDLCDLYNTFDVLANPSFGEGFGVPIVEAQACGVPVIVTDHTAMPELCGAGWLVNGDLWFDGPHEAFFKAPSVTDIELALAYAHEHRDDQTLKDKARSFALSYDADKVLQEHWVPVLEALSVAERTREVPPLEMVAA